MTTTQNEELMLFCAQNNEPSFNYNKAIEEAIEFVEVLIKLQTKHITNEKRPDPKEAIKEFGDLYYRGMIALKTLFIHKEFNTINNEVFEHIQMKLTKLQKYKEEGKYKGGL